MRRSLPVLALLAALVCAVPAAADLRPVRRDFGDFRVPLVRQGTIELPKGHERGRIQVIVQLGQAPLARWGRTPAGLAGRQKLQVDSASSRAYLRQLAEAQQAAAATLRRAIPQASVGRRYRIVLNGFTVELPVRALPRLVRLGFARKVSPSSRFTLNLNQSPAIIGAGQYQSSTGARGDGMKIAVVDDGLDPTNPFFDPAGFTYPAGFPRGGRKWTSPKVIVARTFPGPNSGPGGRLAVDPRASFHGTHVAGIAAGVAGTTAPSGDDHPAVAGLSGVAPRAWIGSYRVFTVPTPVGNVANTPEIIAAFEAAVADGMDVINFSGGGAQSEPANDALVDAVANVSAAGVVPVISAGNDRDEFGFGTAGAPGTSPEAISVAAASNTQVFSSALRVQASGAVIPFRPNGQIPAEWSSSGQTLVDVGTITGTDGRPVDRYLCGVGGSPNGGPSTLPADSLSNTIALVSRGRCTFVSKAARARAAGAIGIVLVDNRAGEANPIPVGLSLPGGMIADLDGARVRSTTASSGGRTTVSISDRAERIDTGRGAVITSFSSAGPTAFDHQLKPDVTAPGGQILSSTLPPFGGPFAVFDGTSMAAPHVAGAAALLLQRHSGWTPRQVKAALVGTAGTAWADTARIVEAPVTLAGGGLVDIPAADDPRVFADPVSLSFGDVKVSGGAAARALSTRIEDAGNGGGPWQVEVRVQAATEGAQLDVPPALSVPPGGDTFLTAVARATGNAKQGENYGLILLRRDGVTRKIPYFFLVTRPALEQVPVTPLQFIQEGNTVTGESRVDAYRYPTWAFGPPPAYGAEQPAPQSGAERLYSVTLDQPVANFGVSVLLQTAGAAIDPWVLGSRDENDVQGAAGTPVNVNGLTFGYRADIGAAGAALPLPGTYYVSVDSGLDPFTGRSLAGSYVLQAWINDVSPPLVLPVMQRVSAGRPTIVARVIDGLFAPESGVDPLSLAIGYRGVLVGAAAYDPVYGLAIFALPRAAPALKAGRLGALVSASDYQEAKNTASVSDTVLPNTTVDALPLQVVNGPTVAWLRPERRECVPRRQQLLVAAGSSTRVRSVRFFVDGKQVGLDRRGGAGLYAASWATGKAKRGTHELRAVVVDSKGRTAAAKRTARVCR
ncbi:MAG: S8 family serine peptidase [Gaiellaceae bacterium]